MAKALILTEKPSVSRDIVEALGGFEKKADGEYYESDRYVCTYAVGHILSLLAPEDIDPTYKRWRLADLPIIPDEFKIKPVDGQKGRLSVIKKLINRTDVEELINACDAAREGELIFREIIKYFQSSKPIKRLWLQSMTKNAIRTGFKSLHDGDDYRGLAAAAECRSFSDWLIGMNATRALTVRLKSRSSRGASWSAGRVQTPTLALLVKRELEILSHQPKAYWRVHAEFQATDHKYLGTWFDPNFKKSESKPDLREDRIFDRELADKIYEDIKGAPGEAREVRKPKSRRAPMLFDLTTAQKEANRRFSWTAKRTLAAAQRCYEVHKVLTYPRTSSRVLPEDYRAEVEKILNIFAKNKSYGEFALYLQKNGRKNEDKVFNDAGVSDHFAIIPTGEIARLEGDDQRFFDLVSRTFLAVFYPPAIYEEIERITEIKSFHFKSRPPLILKEAGWQAVFGKTVENQEQTMPSLVSGQNKASGISVNHRSSELEELKTKPPARIGEAGLLSLMENAGRQVEDEDLSNALQRAEGLGTAATRADIIENLKNKEYVDRSLRPTVKGIRLIDILHRIKASRLTSAALTGQLEFHLDEVERGKRTAKDFLLEVEGITKELVDAARDFDYEEIYDESEELGACPRCAEPVFERAWFYGCRESTKRADEDKKCEFLIWKDHYGRYIDKQSVQMLLRDKTTGDLDGFRSSSGKTYKAVLTLEDGEIVRKPVESSDSDDEAVQFEVDETPLGPCPIHAKECQVVETETEFICEQKLKAKKDREKSPKGFSFPRVLCKREMTREEIKYYIENKETKFLTKFISKRGRPFSAKLKLQSSGGFIFEFPQRGSKKDSAADDSAGGDKTAKESPAKKKASRKKSSD